MRAPPVAAAQRGGPERAQPAARPLQRTHGNRHVQRQLYALGQSRHVDRLLRLVGDAAGLVLVRDTATQRVRIALRTPDPALPMLREALSTIVADPTTHAVVYAQGREFDGTGAWRLQADLPDAEELSLEEQEGLIAVAEAFGTSSAKDDPDRLGKAEKTVIGKGHAQQLNVENIATIDRLARTGTRRPGVLIALHELWENYHSHGDEALGLPPSFARSHLAAIAMENRVALPMGLRRIAEAGTSSTTAFDYETSYLLVEESRWGADARYAPKRVLGRRDIRFASGSAKLPSGLGRDFGGLGPELASILFAPVRITQGGETVSAALVQFLEPSLAELVVDYVGDVGLRAKSLATARITAEGETLSTTLEQRYRLPPAVRTLVVDYAGEDVGSTLALNRLQAVQDRLVASVRELGPGLEFTWRAGQRGLLEPPAPVVEDDDDDPTSQLTFGVSSAEQEARAAREKQREALRKQIARELESGLKDLPKRILSEVVPLTPAGRPDDVTITFTVPEFHA